MSNEERLQPIYLEPPPEIATLDCGTSAGGNDIFINQIIAPNDYTTVWLFGLVFSESVATTLYLNDDDGGSSWNSASINIVGVRKDIYE